MLLSILYRIITAAVAAFQAALATGDSGQADATWPAAKEALEDRARRRDVVIRAGRALAQQSDAIKRQGGTVKDSSFLPFAFRFTLGTAGAAQPDHRPPFGPFALHRLSPACPAKIGPAAGRHNRMPAG